MYGIKALLVDPVQTVPNVRIPVPLTNRKGHGTLPGELSAPRRHASRVPERAEERSIRSVRSVRAARAGDNGQ